MGEVAVHACSPRAPCADDATHCPEGSAKRVYARLFECLRVLLVHTFGLRTRGLKEHGRAAIELLEGAGVDLGHLEDRDTDADDKETHDHCDDLVGRRGKALE